MTVTQDAENISISFLGLHSLTHSYTGVSARQHTFYIVDGKKILEDLWQRIDIIKFLI